MTTLEFRVWALILLLAALWFAVRGQVGWAGYMTVCSAGVLWWGSRRLS